MGVKYYAGILKSVAFEQIGENKSDACVLRFSVEQESVNGQWVPIEPMTRSVSLFLTPKALKYSQAKLAKLEWNKNLDNPRLAERLYVDFSTLSCTEDGQYTNWDMHDLQGAPEATPISDDSKRRLRDLMGLTGGTPSPGAIPAPVTAAPAPAPSPAPAPAPAGSL